MDMAENNAKNLTQEHSCDDTAAPDNADACECNTQSLETVIKTMQAQIDELKAAAAERERVHQQEIHDIITGLSGSTKEKTAFEQQCEEAAEKINKYRRKI